MQSLLATYSANKVLDHLRGKTAFTMPVAYIALFRVTAGSNAASPRSTAVTVGQVTVPATPNGYAYRCTTAGTTGSGEPTWGTTSGGTTTDGTAVWTEMTPDFQGNTSNLTSVEANYTGYARVSTAGTDWNAAASRAGTNATNTTFGGCTAGTNFVFAYGAYDASTTGNLLWFEMLTTPVTISTTYTPPSIAAGSNSLSIT